MGILARLADLISVEGKAALKELEAACREGLGGGEEVTNDHLDQLKSDCGLILAEQSRQQEVLTVHEAALARQNEIAEVAMEAGDEVAARSALKIAMEEEEAISHVRSVVEMLNTSAAEFKELIRQAAALQAGAARERSLLETRRCLAETKRRAIGQSEAVTYSAGEETLRESVAAAEARVEALQVLATLSTGLEESFLVMEKDSFLEARLASLRSAKQSRHGA